MELTNEQLIEKIEGMIGDWNVSGTIWITELIDRFKSLALPPSPVDGLLPCPFKPPFKVVIRESKNIMTSETNRIIYVIDSEGLAVHENNSRKTAGWICEALNEHSVGQRSGQRSGMSNEWAFNEAIKRWGESAFIQCYSKQDDKKHEPKIVYEVGYFIKAPENKSWIGDSWEAAFAAADKAQEGEK